MTAARFADMAAVVTGASGGVGAALSLALAREGARLLLAGRSAERLEAIAKAAHGAGAPPIVFAEDLTTAGAAERLAARVDSGLGRLDLLVHSTGTFSSTPLQETSPDELDRLYRVNTRAPFLVTRALLPGLCERRGQIAFVNSSVAIRARGGVGPYAASKQALRALADALRDEVDAVGVRVLSVYLGRTATPMQEEVHRLEGRPYRPELLLQPEDVATAILDTLGLPRSSEVVDLHLRPKQNR